MLDDKLEDSELQHLLSEEYREKHDKLDALLDYSLSAGKNSSRKTITIYLLWNEPDEGLGKYKSENERVNSECEYEFVVVDNFTNLLRYLNSKKYF